MEIPRGLARSPGSTARLPEDAWSPKRFISLAVGLVVMAVMMRMEGGVVGSWPNIAVVLGAMALVGVLVFFSGRGQGDRMLEVAAARGFSREPAESLLRPKYTAMPLPYNAGSRRFHRVLRNRVNGVDVWLFTLENTASQSQMTPGIVAFDLGSPELPSFQVRPKGFMESGKVVEFPEDPEFARRFHVTGDDEAALRRLISPSVRRLFLELEQPWWVGGGGRWLVAYQQNRYLKLVSSTRWDWRRVDPVLDTAARIFTVLTGR